MNIIKKKDENQREHINGKVLIKTDPIPYRISKTNFEFTGRRLSYEY